jgi:DNA replication and repair protein RecF
LRKKNGYKISKVSEMIGSFRAVLFYPDNLSLVKDGPDERRAFINVAAASAYPSYVKTYADYKKALENRNCLLKFASKGYYYDESELYSWSRSMAEYASHVYMARVEYINKLQIYARKILLEISDGKEELTLEYKSDIPDGVVNRIAIRDEYIRLFTENISREVAAGITLFGPHRDDIDIRIGDIPARSFASQGQQRSIVLAMKLGEGEVCRDITGEYPVFLFDDVLSELDEKRREYVLRGSGERQIIITSCESDEYSSFANREIDVSDGKYQVIY